MAKKMVGFRLEYSDYMKLVMKAESSGLSLSEYCRKVIVEEKTLIKDNTKNEEYKKARLYKLHEISKYIRAVSNNTNQIAKNFNTLLLNGELSQKDISNITNKIDNIKEEVEDLKNVLFDL